MSVIQNKPKRKMALIQKVREQLEHRAMWLALLKDEAIAKGVNPNDFGRDACFACGCLQGERLSNGSTDFRDLKKKLFTKGAQWIFEMDIKKSTSEELSIDFHYCPLVAGWQKMGKTDEEIAELCDTAMCGDRGIASKFGGVMELGKVISKGDNVCEVRFHK